jgi:DNA-binding response OmpR family regulator
MAASPQTVLVVEDESSIASFVAAYLKNAGYAVRTTPSWQVAL